MGISDAENHIKPVLKSPFQFPVDDLVRFTEERWENILNEHAEFSYNDADTILEAVEDPEYIW